MSGHRLAMRQLDVPHGGRRSLKQMHRIPQNTDWRRLGWVALAFVFFTVCASGANELEPVAGQPSARDFSLSDLAGKPRRLSEYEGKVVLVSFWATWCSECIFEMPSLQNLSNALPDTEFVILAINVGEDLKRVRSFAERQGLSFPILLDKDLTVYRKWPVLGVPTSFVIDKQGGIRYSVIGAIDWLSPATVATVRALTLFDQN